jgi:hypothetical protein
MFLRFLTADHTARQAATNHHHGCHSAVKPQPNPNIEIRMSKSETNPNDQNSKFETTGRAGLENLRIGILHLFRIARIRTQMAVLFPIREIRGQKIFAARTNLHR